MIQLEDWLDGNCREVVRYDHDATNPGGHDVTTEGIYRIVYRDDEKYRTEPVSPPIPSNHAFDIAEGEFREHIQQFIKRFEQWHEVTEPSDL